MIRLNADERKIALLIAVAALGYFVDLYDLLLFSAIRKESLHDIGISDIDSLSIGLGLLNWQMVGLLIGAVCWGIIGDKKGRVTILFGSILIYSIANLLNAHVQTILQYEWLRFFAGFGLAGELGAGITLVTEIMPKEKRGIGTTIIGGFGLLGAVVASLIGLEFGWRNAFSFGGYMGLALLVLRYFASESKLFEQLVHKKQVSRGDILLFFKPHNFPKRLLKLTACVLVGAPVFFVVGLLITGAPEFGKVLGVNPIPQAGKAVMFCYLGMSTGDIICGVISQYLKSRKKALLFFAILSGITISIYLYIPVSDISLFYWKCGLVGFGVGFWVLINTNTSEQFGTNLRATVTTLSPNLIRALLIPIAALFEELKNYYDLITTGTIIGSLCFLASIISIYCLEETFQKDLDYNEE